MKKNIYSAMFSALLSLGIIFGLFSFPANAAVKKSINSLEISEATLSFEAGDSPVFTGKIIGGAKDACSLYYERWSTLDSDGNVTGECYSDGRDPFSAEKITSFEQGKTYYYSAMIYTGEQGGYPGQSFDLSAFTAVLNGNVLDSGVWVQESMLYLDKVYAFTVGKGQSEEITEVEISDVKFDYLPGQAPTRSAVKSGDNADKFDIIFERMEEMSQDGTEPVAFWYSDESQYTAATPKFDFFKKDTNYLYSLSLKAKDGYKFAQNLNIKLNGDVPKYAIISMGNGGLTCFCDNLKSFRIKEQAPIRYGILSGGETVSVTDALMALQASIGKLSLADDLIIAADVDGDQKITVTDALFILQKSVGKLELFPVEQNRPL